MDLTNSSASADGYVTPNDVAVPAQIAGRQISALFSAPAIWLPVCFVPCSGSTSYSHWFLVVLIALSALSLSKRCDRECKDKKSSKGLKPPVRRISDSILFAATSADRCV